MTHNNRWKWELFGEIESISKHAPAGAGKKFSDCTAIYLDRDDPEDEPRAIAEFLREWADSLDPEMVCTNCGRRKYDHYREPPRGMWHCGSRYGPIVQHDWWVRP